MNHPYLKSLVAIHRPQNDGKLGIRTENLGGECTRKPAPPPTALLALFAITRSKIAEPTKKAASGKRKISCAAPPCLLRKIPGDRRIHGGKAKVSRKCVGR